MAKIVIDLDDKTYKAFTELISINLGRSNKGIIEKCLNAIKHGKVLPKGHGRLKDVEKIYADISEKEELARQRVIDTPTNSPCYLRYVAQLNERTAFKEMLYDAPTIIEADKEERII